MAENTLISQKPRILVVGGGYVGFYSALRLQKKIKRLGGVVTLVDPLPYMTYQPFLPEVIAGSIHPTNAVVPFRRHLKDTELISGTVTSINQAKKIATVKLDGTGQTIELPYTDVIVAAGAITRGFPIKGLSEYGISVKTIEEAVDVHTKVLQRLEQASMEKDPEVRKRLLTFVVVGAGFNGVETMGEMQNMLKSAVAENPRINMDELRFVLVESEPRIMPEVSEKQAQYVVDKFRERGIEVLVGTSLSSAEDGMMTLTSRKDNSVVEQFKADTLIWAAGVQANPVARFTDFPVNERGKVEVKPDLRIAGDKGVIEHAWSAGDIAAVPDLSGGGVGGFCVPNAQHALRQAKRLTKNLMAVKNNRKTKDYIHYNLGAVAGLGLYRGVATIILGRTKIKIPLRGLLAWFAHRGYHGLALPTIERKVRVIIDWIVNFFTGRDITYLPDYISAKESFRRALNPPMPEDKKSSEDKNKANDATDKSGKSSAEPLAANSQKK